MIYILLIFNFLIHSFALLYQTDVDIFVTYFKLYSPNFSPLNVTRMSLKVQTFKEKIIAVAHNTTSKHLYVLCESAKLRTLCALAPTRLTHHWYAPYASLCLRAYAPYSSLIRTLRACALLLSPIRALRAFFVLCCCLFIYLFIHLFIYLFIHLFIYLFIYSFIHLFIYLFIIYFVLTTKNITQYLIMFIQ